MYFMRKGKKEGKERKRKRLREVKSEMPLTFYLIHL